jgi:hypothetical protein
MRWAEHGAHWRGVKYILELTERPERKRSIGKEA